MIGSPVSRLRRRLTCLSKRLTLTSTLSTLKLVISSPSRVRPRCLSRVSILAGCCGEETEGHVRLNFATSRALLVEILERMEAALSA